MWVFQQRKFFPQGPRQISLVVTMFVVFSISWVDFRALEYMRNWRCEFATYVVGFPSNWVEFNALWVDFLCFHQS